jgi:hypothetical protein
MIACGPPAITVERALFSNPGTNRTSYLERFADLLREAGHDPVILRGGMGGSW